MTDTPTLANAAAPAAAPAPAAPPASTAPPTPAQRVTPGSPEWSALTQEQRHAALRGPPNPRAKGHSPARDTYEQIRHAQDQAPGEAPPPPAADQQPPTADAGARIKIGRYEVSEQEVGEMLQRQASDDLRKANVPSSPQDYKLALPESLTLPGNAKFTFDEAGNKASFDAVKAWSHSKGFDQATFSEMMGLYASHHAAQESMLSQRAQAELQKTGPNAPMRMDAITRFVRAEMGDADARPVPASMVTEAQVRFMERVMQKISSQGAASFSAQHRVPPDAAKIPGYDKMSFEQRRFAQDQAAARTRR